MAKMVEKKQRNFQKTRFYDSCMLLVHMGMINYLFLFYFLSINIKYKLIVCYPFALYCIFLLEVIGRTPRADFEL